MKNYSERTKDILAKAASEKRRRRRTTAVISTLTCLAVCVSLVLWNPANMPAQQGQYSDSEYAEIIEKLNKLEPAPGSSGSFGDILAGITTDDILGIPDGGAVPEAAPPSGAPNASTGTNKAEDITDIQVDGVDEADLIKRTGQHIYYLRGTSLSVYTIAGEASELVGNYEITFPEYRYKAWNTPEMYLSTDGASITILSYVADNVTRNKYVLALNLDVTDPTQIKETGRMYLAGNYLSSRFTDGNLYVISQFTASTTNYSDPTDFIPYYGTPEESICISPDQIYAPNELTNRNYTVVSKLDGSTLEMLDSAAYLSYSTEVYVSADSIFLTRSYTDTVKNGDTIARTAKTEIARLNYEGQKLVHAGSTIIDGRILNQYSMDQKGDVLRVVSTISRDTYQEFTDGEMTSMSYLDNQLNASLYCIDLNTWETVAAVEAFAPQGEKVRSVRFDGDNAYVCTSIRLMDPVFFFDLSDLNNITWKDTCTIDGYSMSLIDFAEGYLMGIGYGASTDTLKIEIYQEDKTAVESRCKYEQRVLFAEEYKAYYIDRENGLIGLPVWDFMTGDTFYVLLHFDGSALNEVCQVPAEGTLDNIRGVYIDGYLYVLGDGFAVEKIG